MKPLFKFYVLVFLTIAISGCSIFGGSNKVENLIETFFVGEAGTQYYIKPIEFESEDGDELVLDITFRYKDEIKDSATINFTFIRENLIKKLDVINVSDGSSEYSTTDNILLFAERIDDDFKSRFSFRIPMSELDKLMMNPNWILSLESNNEVYKYFPTSSTKDILSTINDYLFIIFR